MQRWFSRCAFCTFSPMTPLIYWGVSREAGIYRVAVPDIYDELALERIRIESGCRVIPEQHSEKEIRQMIREHAQKSADNEMAVLEAAKSSGSRANSWESEPIINLVDSLIERALELKASDIHLEPGEDAFRVRFRIDGMLETYKELPAWLGEPVLIRLKLLASVDITERRLPHDGSFTFPGIYQNVNIRLSTLPIQAGEKCVLRLLQAGDSGQTLESLEFEEATLRAFREIFGKPQGLFLITGPTGSGKTTTLYAGLREILQKQVNVTTIEDPVEYPLKGANQVQVNSKCGFTFATAMRSILRQDPDIILIGEIRDEETARIAVQAAETGHLVLSTLHTNNAKAAIDRLRDLGVLPEAIRDSLLGIAAQRLLRKKDASGKYKGRIATVEFLKPEGTFVQGTMLDYARTLAEKGITDMAEIRRVLG